MGLYMDIIKDFKISYALIKEYDKIKHVEDQ